jgi:hypothetical protein
MDFHISKLEKLRSDLKVLVKRHRRTRAWFWRTGMASLAGAGLWIIIYCFASDNAGVKETLAIIVGAILMWTLFLWAFLLLRKLNRLTEEVRKIEAQLVDMLSQDGARPDDETA